MNSGTEGTDERVESGSCHLLEVVKATQEQLRQLIRQRTEIVKRIGTMKRTIVGLAKLYGDDWLNEELGICRSQTESTATGNHQFLPQGVDGGESPTEYS
jgi:hypothetical protein